MDQDSFATAYAELKGKIRWALQTSLVGNFSYSDGMNWAGHYAADAMEQWKIMNETPDYRPYATKNGSAGGSKKTTVD